MYREQHYHSIQYMHNILPCIPCSTISLCRLTHGTTLLRKHSTEHKSVHITYHVQDAALCRLYEAAHTSLYIYTHYSTTYTAQHNQIMYHTHTAPLCTTSRQTDQRTTVLFMYVPTANTIKGRC